MKKVISTTNAPAAIGPYSQAIEANGFVFASGQIPVNPATGEVAEGIEGQAEQVMKNMKNLLEAAGTSMENVVKTTVFIQSMDDFATINGIYSKYFFGQKPHWDAGSHYKNLFCHEKAVGSVPYCQCGCHTLYGKKGGDPPAGVQCGWPSAQASGDSGQ